MMFIIPAKANWVIGQLGDWGNLGNWTIGQLGNLEIKVIHLCLP